MRLIKEIIECLPKVCHNIALISTELYYILFKRIDALQAEIDELKVILIYDIENLKSINDYYKDVLDKVTAFSRATNLYMGAVRELDTSRKAIDVMLDTYKDRLEEHITEDSIVYPEGLLDVTGELVKSEEAVKDLNTELDTIAEDKAQEIEAKREALQTAQNNVDAANKQAEAAKRNVEALQRELEKAKAQADAYNETLAAEAERGEPGKYIVTNTPFVGKEIISEEENSKANAVTKKLREMATVDELVGQKARAFEEIIEKTDVSFQAADEALIDYETALSLLDSGMPVEEVKEQLKETYEGVKAQYIKPEDIGRVVDAVVQTAQEQIDIDNAAAGIQGALNKISELENQLGAAKDKYKKAIDDVVSAKADLETLSNTISSDTRGAVEEAKRDGGDSGDSGSGGGGERDTPRENASHDDKAEKEREAREKLERDIEEGKYDKDIQDEYDKTHRDDDDDDDEN